MARTYLFFQPSRLPLASNELDATTVLGLAAEPRVKSAIEQALPGLSWQTNSFGRASLQGNWYEVHLPETAEQTLSLRCSLRTEASSIVQRICDLTGWLAFDEHPMCFQPNKAPMPA